MYCGRCKLKTDTNDVKVVTLKNGKHAERGTCARCGIKKYKITKSVSCGDLVSTINSFTKGITLPGNKYPGEAHLFRRNFLGPGTRLDLRLNPDGTPKPDSIPVDRVDEAAWRHDLAYSKFDDAPTRNVYDRRMVNEIDAIQNPTPMERITRAIAKSILLGKSKLGLGLKKKH